MGAQLGSSVAFGSGCGQALPGVPRAAQNASVFCVETHLSAWTLYMGRTLAPSNKTPMRLKMSSSCFELHKSSYEAPPKLPSWHLAGGGFPGGLLMFIARGLVPRVAPATPGAGAGGGAPPSSSPSHFTEHDIYDQELGRPMRVKG